MRTGEGLLLYPWITFSWVDSRPALCIRVLDLEYTGNCYHVSQGEISSSLAAVLNGCTPQTCWQPRPGAPTASVIAGFSAQNCPLPSNSWGGLSLQHSAPHSFLHKNNKKVCPWSKRDNRPQMESPVLRHQTATSNLTLIAVSTSPGSGVLNQTIWHDLVGTGEAICLTDPCCPQSRWPCRKQSALWRNFRIRLPSAWKTPPFWAALGSSFLSAGWGCCPIHESRHRPLKSLQLNSVFHTPHPQFPSPAAARTALALLSFFWPLSGLCFIVSLAGSCLCIVTEVGEWAEAKGETEVQAEGETSPPPPSPFPLQGFLHHWIFQVDTYPWHSAGKNPKPFVSEEVFFLHVCEGKETEKWENHSWAANAT